MKTVYDLNKQIDDLSKKRGDIFYSLRCTDYEIEQIDYAIKLLYYVKYIIQANELSKAKTIINDRRNRTIEYIAKITSQPLCIQRTSFNMRLIDILTSDLSGLNWILELDEFDRMVH